MMNLETLFEQILKKFLHDPVDKCLDIPTHIERAKGYAEILDITDLEEKGLYRPSDSIASAMERSILPEEAWKGEKKITQELTEIRHPLSEGKIPNEKMQIPLKDYPEKFRNEKEIKELIEEAYKELKELTQSSNNQTKLLIIYRNLFDKAQEKLKSKYPEIAKLIQILPADTRTPDHSLFEHLKITSAINAFENYQNNSLFFFTIGGVQSFISQARKTQDLYMGSFIFSYLTFKAIEKVVEIYGPTSVVYPDLYGQPLFDWYLKMKNIPVTNSFADYANYPTIPNKFVAILPQTDAKEIKKLADEIKQEVKNEWLNAVNKVLEKFELSEINEKQINIQTSDFPQIFWVAVPWRIKDNNLTLNDLKDFMDEKNFEKWEKLWEFAKNPNVGLLYQPIYLTGEKFLRARKNLREFAQNPAQEIAREKKCSICGERDSIISAGRGNLSVGKFINSKERLCIICFTKRGFEEYIKDKIPHFQDFSYPSTAEVALADFKEEAIKKAKAEFEDYVNEFKKIAGDKFQFGKPLPKLEKDYKILKENNLEGEWFYEENLTKEKFKEELGLENVSDKDIKSLKEKLQKIIKKIGNPNPYYAVLALDGDNMGKWLAGELLPGIENSYNSEVWERLSDDFKTKIKEISPQKILTPAIHAAISHALRNYSIEFVRKIVEEEHLGVVVYSGGDDLLVFVNLKHLFPVMRKLRAGFSGQIELKNSKIGVDWDNNSGFVDMGEKIVLTMGKKATASCGVVIAHYKEPLKLALDKVREMERKAKDEGGRDAFAIAFLRHSGEERVALSKWRYDSLDVIKELEEIAKSFVEKENSPWLSKGFITKFADSFKRIKKEDGTLNVADEIKHGLFNAELKRIISRSVSGGNKDEREEKVKQISDHMTNLFWKYENIDNFIDLIYTASFVKSMEE